MTRVFVTREIRKNYPFHNYFKHSNVKYQGESLIKFSPLSFELNDLYDWYFFYSKNGWKFFRQQLSKNEIEKHLRKHKIAAIGSATAEKIEKSGFDCEFSGKGNPRKTVEKFSETAKLDENILCIRAKSSSDSIKMKLDSRGFNVQSLPVYDNTKMKNVDIADHDIAVITSSRNAEFYNQLYGNKGQQIIAIGNPTTNTLKKLKFTEIIKAPQPSEKHLVQTLKKVLSS